MHEYLGHPALVARNNLLAASRCRYEGEMANTRYRFVAESLGAGAVSEDGENAVIEFFAGDELMWITVPVHLLRSLSKMAADLEALGYDARNGVAQAWHIPNAREE
jgi:hypothetical protein